MELDSAEAGDGEDPRRKKLIELGEDPSLLETEPQLAEALLASAFLKDEEAEAEEKKRKEAEAA